MSKIKVITDSCSSLSPEKMQELGVDWVEMGITIDGQSCNAFEHPTKDPEQFYKNLEKAKKCFTSCVNTQTFTDIFEKYVKQGFDVIYMGLSSGLSSTYYNALNAAKEINESMGQHVWVADSLTGSHGIALMVEKTLEMAKEGKSCEEILKAIDKNGLKNFSIFIPSDLQFLMRSGRISALAAGVGTMLKLVPIIVADEEGKLKTIAKCIGRKKATKTIENFILENADLSSSGTIYISHTNQKEAAEEMAEFLKANTQNKNIKIDYIDYTMGCCCGPNTLAIFGATKKN